MPDPVELTLFSRPGCHLCEVARHQLAAVEARFGFRTVEVNVESDPEIEDRYGFEIPVVEVAGAFVTCEPIDLGAIQKAVLEARMGDIPDFRPRPSKSD